MNKHYFFFGFDMRRPLHVEAEDHKSALAQLVHHLESKGRLGHGKIHKGSFYVTENKPKQSSRTIIKSCSPLPCEVDIMRVESSDRVVVDVKSGQSMAGYEFICPDFVVTFDGGHSKLRVAS